MSDGLHSRRRVIEAALGRVALTAALAPRTRA